MHADTPLLAITGLTKRFGGTLALDSPAGGGTRLFGRIPIA